MKKKALELAGSILLALLLALPAFGQPEDEEGAMSMEEITRMLDNPLGNLWILFLQNDYARFKGRPAGGWKDVNVFTIQPILPIGLTEDWNLVTRPIIPIVSAPKFGIPNFGDCPGNCNSRPPPDPSLISVPSSRENELGDTVIWSMLSPSEPPKLWDGSSFVWGVGPSFRFPTATEDQFGSEKWSVGPSNIVLRLPPPEGHWTFGLFQHHHFSFAGQDSRASVRHSQFQPLYWYKLTDDGAWSIGGFPIIDVNWKASNDNKLTLPLELAISHTMFIGPMPVRLIFGANYSVVRPDDYGARYMFKFALVPVIPRLIKEPLFSRSN